MPPAALRGKQLRISSTGRWHLPRALVDQWTARTRRCGSGVCAPRNPLRVPRPHPRTAARPTLTDEPRGSARARPPRGHVTRHPRRHTSLRATHRVAGPQVGTPVSPSATCWASFPLARGARVAMSLIASTAPRAAGTAASRKCCWRWWVAAPLYAARRTLLTPSLRPRRMCRTSPWYPPSASTRCACGFTPSALRCCTTRRAGARRCRGTQPCKQRPRRSLLCRMVRCEMAC